MKTLLKISLCLNLGLAVSLILILPSGHRQVSEAAPRTAVETPPPVSELASSAPALQVEAKPFHWCQLEAKDYHVYVKNLRRIRCPELALRAIVSADVRAASHAHVLALEKKLADLENSSWSDRLASFKSEAALKAELQALPGAEDLEIADLLGLPSAPAEAAPAVADSAPEAELGHRHIPPNRPVSKPLVLQDVDLTALKLNDVQAQVINNVRQAFVQAIGGSNQDANDPAYLQRWQQAQPAADDMLRGMLGAQFFANYQMAAQGNSR